MSTIKHNPKNGNERINWPFYNLLSMIVAGCFVTIGVATDHITTGMLMNAVENFGLPGVILAFWYAANRGHQRVNEQNQKNMQRYHDDVTDMRQMYENNVHLVQKYQDLSVSFKDIVVMNTQAVADMCNKIECALDEIRKAQIRGEQ